MIKVSCTTVYVYDHIKLHLSDLMCHSQLRSQARSTIVLSGKYHAQDQPTPAAGVPNTITGLITAPAVTLVLAVLCVQ